MTETSTAREGTRERGGSALCEVGEAGEILEGRSWTLKSSLTAVLSIKNWSDGAVVGATSEARAKISGSMPMEARVEVAKLKGGPET